MKKNLILLIMLLFLFPGYALNPAGNLGSELGIGILYADSSGISNWYRPEILFMWNTGTGFLAGNASFGKLSFDQQHIHTDIIGGGITVRAGSGFFEWDTCIRSYQFRDFLLQIPNGIPLVDSNMRISGTGGNLLLYGNAAGIQLPSIPVSLKIGATVIAGSWNYGDLYYFYGHPVLPATGIYSASITLSDMIQISCTGFYANPAVYSNDNLFYLGDMDLQYYRCGIGFKTKKNQHILNGIADYIYLNCEGLLSLTSQNQQYLFFPYKYLSADASAFFHLLHMVAGWQWQSRGNISLISIKAGGVVCLYDREQYSVTYLEKDNLFFDGNSGSTADSLSLFQGSALLYGYISYTFKPVSWFSLSAEKLFILPVAGERFREAGYPASAGETGSGVSVTGGGQILESIKTVLLSGLSFSVSVFL